MKHQILRLVDFMSIFQIFRRANNRHRQVGRNTGRHHISRDFVT